MTNTQTVAELLAGFFHFYAFVFDWKSHVVCPRLGTHMEKRQEIGRVQRLHAARMASTPHGEEPPRVHTHQNN
jgi:hypothetical protein